jgi:cytochrome P450
VLAFEPICREIARSLLEPMRARTNFDCMEELALPFALRCQCRFLGWPEALAEPLRSWAQKNQQATRAADRAQLTELAHAFRSHIHRLLEERRQPGAPPFRDATQSLLEARVNGERLTNDELVSIFRNWTVGELGTLAGSIGILVWQLANDTALQRRLREETQLLPAAIDEILRVQGLA